MFSIASLACIIIGLIYYKPYLGIVFVIFSIPLEGKINLGHFSIYPLEAILVTIIVICIYKLIVRKINYFRNTKLIYCYLPFLFFILLSALKSMGLSLTIKEIVRWFDLFIIYFLTINLIDADKKLRIVLYSMFFTVTIVSICGIVNYIGGNVVDTENVHRASSLFGNPNTLAGFACLTLPVLFGIVMTGTFLWKRITLLFITAVSVSALFLSFSRSSWISLIFTMILTFFLIKVKKKVVLIFLMLFTILAIPFLFSDIRESFIHRFGLESTRNSIVKKTMNHSIGFNMVREDLFFGIGAGNYPLLIKKFTKREVLIQNNLHNLYLQIFVETGLMGLCAFVFWLTCIIKYFMGALKSLENSGNYSLYLGLVGGIIVYLFNNFANILTVHGIHLQWSILIGLAVVLTQFREFEECPEIG